MDADKKHEHGRTIQELLNDWENGNKKDVIRNLSMRHPVITAHLILEGIKSGVLELGECNSITNMLMDDMIQIRDSKGLEYTCRPQF